MRNISVRKKTDKGEERCVGDTICKAKRLEKFEELRDF